MVFYNILPFNLCGFGERYKYLAKNGKLFLFISPKEKAQSLYIYPNDNAVIYSQHLNPGYILELFEFFMEQFQKLISTII